MLSANNIPFDYLLTLLRELGEDMDGTAFYFLPERGTGTERTLGCLPAGPHTGGLPYWAENCDRAEGLRCETAEQLLDAPVYGGRSLRERWSEVWLYRIGGMYTNDFISRFGDQYSPDAYR